MTKRPVIFLDKAERNLIEKIKKARPEYAHLEDQQIAHLELKNRLVQLSNGPIAYFCYAIVQRIKLLFSYYIYKII